MSVTCTCGSKSVGSHLHSAWCDVVSQRSRTDFSFLLNETSTHPYGAFIYLCTASAAKVKFEEFKQFSDGQWSMTAEQPGYYTVCFKNGSEVLFTRSPDDEGLCIRGRASNGVLVEKCDYAERLVDLSRSVVMTNRGWVRIVDPGTKEVS